LPEPDAINPEIPGVAVAVHVKVDEGSADVSTTAEVDCPAQTFCERVALLTVGIGLTVATKLNGGPGQFVGAGPVGVITYVTWPGVIEFAGSDRILFIFPLPGLEFPETVPEVTDDVQVNVVPTTLLVGM
jgi:hypothetical protein